MVLADNYGIPLPKDTENEILHSVMVLLVTMNLNESSAIHRYIQPLDGHKNVYMFDQHGQNSKVITYYIGKYGACPAAIRDVLPRFEVCDSTDSTVPVMADQCFPNLGAIISVGVACGIAEDIKLCDVLVSSEVIVFENKDMLHFPNNETIKVSPQLCRLFTHPIQWPSYEIKKRLKDNGVQLPNVKSGLILSGPFLDDIAMESLSKNFSNRVIGMEIKGTNLFTAKQQTIINSIIVKAVCDFGDGVNDEKYQPTAALLSADLVEKCLSDPQALEVLQGYTFVFVRSVRPVKKLIVTL